MSKKHWVAIGIGIVIVFFIGRHIYERSQIPGYYGDAENSTTTIYGAECETGKLALEEELYVNSFEGSTIKYYLTFNGQRLQQSEYYFSSLTNELKVSAQFYTAPKNELAKASFPTYLYKSESIEDPGPMILYKPALRTDFDSFNVCMEQNVAAMKAAYSEYTSSQEKRNKILSPGVMSEAHRFIGAAYANDSNFDRFSNEVSDRLSGTNKIQQQNAIRECSARTGGQGTDYLECLREAGVVR